jgi:hypothetical protein
MIEVPPDHKHVWAVAGCWCGAHRCKYHNMLRFPFGQCKQEAVIGSFCLEHESEDFDPAAYEC